jgi:hypothetical protein
VDGVDLPKTSIDGAIRIVPIDSMWLQSTLTTSNRECSMSVLGEDLCDEAYDVPLNSSILLRLLL